MPTYEFRAPDGTIIERSFRMSEVPESILLPDGLGVAVRVISGGSGLIFKGSGFYITDYGKDGKKDQRSTTGSGEGGSAPTDAASKPESKGGDASTGASSTAPAPASPAKAASEPKSSAPSSGASKPSSGE